MHKIILVILSFYTMNTGIAQHNTKIIAHRGAWQEYGLPENSIASLQKAIDLECYGSEFDVRRTKDGVLVVCHDPVYYGDTIELMNYADLNKKKLSNGEDLPTLLNYFKKGKITGSKTKFICEIKQAVTDKALDKIATAEVMQMVKKLGIAKNLVFISFRFEILEWIKEIDPQAIVLYLEADKDIHAIKKAKFDGINYHYSHYLKNEGIGKEAKFNNLMLGSWTVNEEAVLNSLILQDVAFITTNTPTAFKNYLEKQ